MVGLPPQPVGSTTVAAVALASLKVVPPIQLLTATAVPTLSVWLRNTRYWVAPATAFHVIATRSAKVPSLATIPVAGPGGTQTSSSMAVMVMVSGVLSRSPSFTMSWTM